jgi:hypothetical protein
MDDVIVRGGAGGSARGAVDGATRGATRGERVAARGEVQAAAREEVLALARSVRQPDTRETRVRATIFERISFVLNHMMF